MQNKESTMKFTTTAAVLVAAVSCSGLARADTYTVTSLFDSGAGSLRSAIADANTHPGHDTVTFHPSLSGVLYLMSTLFVDDSVTIIGPASRTVAIDGTAAGISLYFQYPLATDLGLIDLELVNGDSFMFVSISQLRLNVQRCVFRNFGEGGALQAGVFNTNWAALRQVTGQVQSCSFINNHGLHAGVITNFSHSGGQPLDFINCTFADNSSTHGAGIAWIWNALTPGQGLTTFTNCTITGNSGGTSGMPFGTIHVATSTTPPSQVACRIRNSILAENSAGAAVSDVNITGDVPAATTLEGTNIFADPGLTPMQRVNNFYVRAPLPGSPCIDAAAADSSVRTDQLGTARPRFAPGATLPAGSDGADIGAVEVVPTPCAADFNRSGAVTVQDIFDFLAAYFAGCP
jgi:hypothetical protein